MKGVVKVCKSQGIGVVEEKSDAREEMGSLVQRKIGELGTVCPPVLQRKVRDLVIHW